MNVIYHYIIRYRFEDESESGRGAIQYDTLTKIEDSPFDIFRQLEKEIGFNRKHRSVSITCYSYLGAELLKSK